MRMTSFGEMLRIDYEDDRANTKPSMTINTTMAECSANDP
jgi:hypothetical protein